MKKAWIRAVVAIVAVLILIAVAMPFVVNADSFRPSIERELSGTLGRKVTLGHLSFSVFTGDLVARNIVIADDPAFSNDPMLTAKSLSIGVELGKLIFHHSIAITRLTLDTPAIQLIRAADGKWNFSSLGEGATSSSSSTQAGSIPALTVDALKIEHGKATVSKLPQTQRPAVYQEIEAEVHDFSLAGAFPFKLSAELPGGGTFELNGEAGPLAQNDAARTPFKAALDVKGYDPVAAGTVDPASGISMQLGIQAQLASDGSTLSSTGKLSALHLHLAKGGVPAKDPVEITYAIASDMKAGTGQVKDIAVHTGSVAAHVTGSYATSGHATMLNLHLAAPNLPIDQLEELLPAVGVTLPSGSQLRGGALSADLAINGPVTAPVVAGPVEIDNTTLAGFDIGSKIQGMNPFGGSGGGTSIQLLRADVNSTPAITQFSKIEAVLPQVGTATGSGSVSSAGALAFTMLAKFTATSGGGLLMSQGLAAATKFLNGQLGTKATNAIPLTIAGTAANPSIRVNLGQMLGGQGAGQSGSSASGSKKTAAGFLKGLFGGR